jgi:hypothetical protein
MMRLRCKDEGHLNIARPIKVTNYRNNAGAGAVGAYACVANYTALVYFRTSVY